MLKLKIGAKVILTVNIDTQDRIINGRIGNIKHIEFAEGAVHKVYVKFSDEQAELKTMRSSYEGRQNSWFPLKNVKLRFQ